MKRLFFILIFIFPLIANGQVQSSPQLDTLKQENKEQIEISKIYERMANPARLATAEFMDDKIYHRKK